MCRTKKNQSNIDDIIENQISESDDNSEFEIDTITVNNADDKQNWFEIDKINNKNIKIKLDSGAQCNIISKEMCDKIGVPLVNSRTKTIVAYSGHAIKVLGIIMNTPVIIRGKSYDMSFVVVQHNATPTMGKNSCELSGLSKRVNSIQKDDIYNGIGCYNNFCV